MQSTCRRLSEPSTACWMFTGARPGCSTHLPTLVAITTCSRLPLRLSHLPMMVSDSPPRLPGTHDEYMSAVSIRLKPASTKASSSSNECASSTLQPNTLPPKASGAMDNDDLPSGRLCTVEHLGRRKTPSMHASAKSSVMHPQRSPVGRVAGNGQRGADSRGQTTAMQHFT